jgi:hypothetical protein
MTYFGLTWGPNLHWPKLWTEYIERMERDRLPELMMKYCQKKKKRCVELTGESITDE